MSDTNEHTPGWIEIHPEQAEMFTKPVGAGAELLFSPYSRQAGVGLYSGLTQPFSVGDEMFDSAAWPEAGEFQAIDVLFAHQSRFPWRPSGFVVVSNAPGEPYEPENASAYKVEGVALSVGNRQPPVSFYGNTIMPKGNVEGDARVKAAADFLGQAILTSRTHPMRQTDSVDSRMGLDSVRAARITASLASLWLNLAHKGRLSEQQHHVTSRAYKVADGLLSTFVDDGRKNRLPDSIPLVGRETQDQIGIAFCDTDGNMTSIRYISTFVPTFIFTTTPRPLEANSPATVEQYFIQARGVFLNTAELPPHQYDLRAMIGKFPELDQALTGSLAERSILGDSGIDLLVDKMSALQGGRKRESAR